MLARSAGEARVAEEEVRQTHRQRHTDRQTDRQTEGHTDAQRYKDSRDRHTDTDTERRVTCWHAVPARRAPQRLSLIHISEPTRPRLI
eukprot:1696998-Rhodomonas_salina.2